VPPADNLYEVPEGLPAPVDDAACDHLPGMLLPSVSLRSTTGELMDHSALAGTSVVYCYPLTGRPDLVPPFGEDEIPGARGCTPQSCAFKDHHADLQALNARVFGLSAQDTGYQQGAAERLHLPFVLLSDEKLEFTGALNLPTFEVEGKTLIERLTLVVRNGRIEEVFYPVFPPGKNAEEVLEWLSERVAS
jgi:peroxiredoxin